MNDRPPLRRLIKYASSQRKKIKLATHFSILNKIFDIFPEILIGVAIDVVVEQEDSFLAGLGYTTPTEQLTVLGLLTFLIWFLESVTEYIAMVNWRNLAQSVQHGLRIDGVRTLSRISISWFTEKHSGTLQSVLNEDVNQVERFINDGAHNLIQLFVSSILIGMVFFYISPLIALTALVPIPIIIYVGFKFRHFLSQTYGDVRNQAGVLGSKLANIITGMVTIRGQVAEEEMIARVTDSSYGYLAANGKAIKISSAFVPVVRMGILMGFLVTLIYGGFKTFSGEISPASYTVLVFLTQRLLWPFTKLGEMVDLFERSMASATRVLDLVDEKDLESSSRESAGAERLLGDIRFDQLRFSYDTRTQVLNDLSLVINEKQLVGIVGGTGAGKSTLVKLLMKFYHPGAGTVSWGQRNLKDISAATVRKNIGYVGQEVFLFDGTIFENLALGNAEATLQEVEDAAKVAEIHEFIMGLPDGYQTQIGEGGQKLSGGQRQRLAIARGIIGDPPLLILDEATSSVDNETERLIQTSLYTLAKQRTVIVIAHRLSTIRKAQQIFVLEGGQVSESGSHEELVALNKTYNRLWRIQTGEILQ